jgi:hypothetical protein
MSHLSFLNFVYPTFADVVDYGTVVPTRMSLLLPLS